MPNISTPEMIETRKSAVAQYARGLGTTAVAELYGVTRETVRRWCRVEGVKTPRPNPVLTPAEIERARTLIAEGASRSEAARTIGRSSQALAARGFAGWTAEQVSAHVSLTKSTENRMLGLRLTA